jgi:hypothetical protein
MDRTEADRGQPPGGSSFAPVNTIGLSFPPQDRGHQGYQGQQGYLGQERQHRPGVGSIGNSMDDTGSSNANTPIATPPSAGLGPAPGDRQLSAAASSATAEGLLPPRRKRNRPAKSCLQCRQRKIKCDQKHPCGSCVRSKFDNCAYAQRQTRTWPPGALSPASPPAPQLSQGPHHDHDHRQQQPLPAPIGHHGTQYNRPHGLQQPHQHLSLPRTTVGSGYGEDANVDSHYAYARSPGTSAAASLPTPATYPSPNSNVNNTAGQATGPDVVSRLEGIIQQLQQQLAQQSKSHESSVGDRTVGNISSQLGVPVPSNVQGLMSKSRYFGQSHWMNGIRFVSPSSF